MDIQIIIALLASPIAFGALISRIAEQTAFFRDEKANPAAKIGLIVGICIAWSFVMQALSPEGIQLTAAGIRAILYNGLAVVVGSQIFHILLNGLLPGLTDFILSLKVATPTLSASTASSSTTVNGKTTETSSTTKMVSTETTPPEGYPPTLPLPDMPVR